MNINLKLSGVVEQIIEEMIAKGYATSKTEAIRMAVLDYKHRHLDKDNEDGTQEDMKDFKQAMKEHKAGKTIPLEEV
ncbi:MAG: hypothetical protein ABID61_04340 [Candidatus Micrarchaeota archaeon]